MVSCQTRCNGHGFGKLLNLPFLDINIELSPSGYESGDLPHPVLHSQAQLSMSLVSCQTQYP
jgi:hypothetical protein